MKVLPGWFILIVASASAQAEPPAPTPFPCTAVDGIEPICGFARPPEDLEDLADGRVLVGEYGAMSGTKPGVLSLFDPKTKARQVLFDGTTAVSATPPGRERDACPGAPGPQFSPHGIHLAQVEGRQRLLVVNHGGREAVEIFDVTIDPATRAVALDWRDCVPAPADAWMNDVVNLPDGGFAASHMIKRGAVEEDFVKAEASHEVTGHVLQWHVERGWEKVPGSEGGLPNGVEVSADGTTLYVNQYLGDRVSAIDRLSGTRLWSADVPAPDNITIAPSGELLVASHRAGFEVIVACAHHSEQACGLPYAVVGIDPKTGATREVLTGAGAPMGAATVALQLGDAIYLGSFVGERIVVRAAPKP